MSSDGARNAAATAVDPGPLEVHAWAYAMIIDVAVNRIDPFDTGWTAP